MVEMVQLGRMNRWELIYIDYKHGAVSTLLLMVEMVQLGRMNGQELI